MKTAKNDNPIRIHEWEGVTPQIRCLRRLLVGAQITAMTSGVEAFSMLIIGLSLIIVNESIDSKMVIAVLFRLLQNIVLPYLYLINTRENRNRIHQQGWMAILPKFVHVGNIVPLGRSNAIIPLNEIAGVNASNIYNIEQKTTQSTNNLDSENIILKNCDCNLNVPFNETPSSSIDYHHNTKPNLILNRKKISRESSIESVNIKTDIPKKRAEILDALLLCLHEEIKYLRLFAHFNYLEAHNYEENPSYRMEMIDQEIILKRFVKLFETNNFPSRNEVREEALQKLKNCINDKDMYQTALDALIDIEEKFLEDKEC